MGMKSVIKFAITVIKLNRRQKILNMKFYSQFMISMAIFLDFVSFPDSELSTAQSFII